MSAEPTTKCDVCGHPVSETAGRYVFGGFLRRVNGEEKEAATRGHEDVCSPACLTTRLAQMLAEVQGAKRTEGGTGATPVNSEEDVR